MRIALHVAAVGAWMAALSWARPARSQCTVDSVDTVVHERSGQRVDTVRLYAESAAGACSWLPLSAAGSGKVISAKVRVLRGDRRNVRFGSEHLVRTSDGGGQVVSSFAIPGVRRGDVVVLKVRREIGADHTWYPGSWGTPGWASLRWKGPREPDASNMNRVRRAWYAERAEFEAAGDNLFVRHGEVPDPYEAMLHDGIAKLDIELLPEPSPPPGQPPLGRTRFQWVLPIGGGVGAVAWPPGATDRVCRVDGGTGARVFPSDEGCTVSDAPEGASLVVGWTLPRLQLAGEVGPGRRAHSYAFGSPWHGVGDSGPLPEVGTRSVGPVDVSVHGAGMSLRAQVRSSGAPPAKTGEGRIQFTVPGSERTDPAGIAPHAGWWVTALHGQPQLADREALMDAVARSAIRASVPEPGLPMQMRLRSGEAEVVPEILRLARSQMHVGRAPGQRSLQPRKLVRARRSGHGSEWELALITARYLRQLKLDAVPIPVRVTHLVAADPGMPSGFDHAVVRVSVPSADTDIDTLQTVWLDPACLVCAPGELRPTLWGADALTESIERLPAASAGREVVEIDLEQDGRENITVTWTGTAAVAQRLVLLAAPPNQRLALLEGLYDADIETHEGLGDLGSPIRLTLSREGVLDPPTPMGQLLVPHAPHVRLGWTGERVHRVRVAPGIADLSLAPAGEVQIGGTGVSWTRTLEVDPEGFRVAEDVLTLDTLVVSRASMIALKDRAREGEAVPLPAPDTFEPPTDTPSAPPTP